MVLDEIDTSLRTEDIFQPTKSDDGSAANENSKEISIDLDNMLQEIQDERDSGQMKLSSHVCDDDDDCSSDDDDDDSHSLSLALDLESETDDDFDAYLKGPQHNIGSSLRDEEFPSSSRFEKWWNSGSTNLKESFGSFRKKMGSSLKKLNYYHQRRKGGGNDLSPKQKTEGDSGCDEPYSPQTSPWDRSPWRKKKKVRFKKFDMVFPFHKSFSRLKMPLSEDEADQTD